MRKRSTSDDEIEITVIDPAPTKRRLPFTVTRRPKAKRPAGYLGALDKAGRASRRRPVP